MRFLPFAILLLLAACGPATAPPSPGEVPDEAHFNQRYWPAERIDLRTYTRERRRALRGRHLRERGFDDAWTVEGPGNLGSRINSIAVDPTDETVQYIGFSNGGLWKTTDDGDSWLPVFDAQAFPVIGDIAIDPQNPQTIYAGTGDPNVSGFPFIGDGLHRSTDGGATWTHLGLEATRVISEVIVHPDDNNTLYVAATGLPMQKTTDRGLYKTTDGGGTWEQVLFLSDSAGITDISLHPTDPDILYAVGYNRIRSNTTSIIRGPESRIYKSADAGATWTALPVDFNAGNDTRIALAQSPTQADRLYALFLNEDFQVGQIVRSDDAGESWTTIQDESDTNGLSDNALGGFGWYFGDLFAVAEDGEDVLFLPGVDLWMWRQGEPWERATPEWFTYDVHADKHDLAVTPSGRLLLATDGGLYRANGLAGLPFDWEDVEDIPTSLLYRVAHDPKDPLSYYGGLQDNGSTGGNAGAQAEWPRIFGGDGFQLRFPSDPDAAYFYVETQRGSVYRYDLVDFFVDNITQQNDSLDADRTNWDTPYRLSVTDEREILLGTYRVWQGYDINFDVSWVPISPDLTAGGIAEQRSKTIKTLTQSAVLPERLYAGTTNGLVWRGRKSTGTWENISAGLPEVFVSDIEASPTFAEGVYVSHSGYRDNDFTPRLHRSLDGGDNWTDLSANLPDLAIHSVFVLPEQQDSVLFVGNDAGVFGSIDGGTSWERVGTNMPAVPVYDLDYNPVTNRLVAGTHGRSIMTYSMDSLLAVAEPPVSTSEPAADRFGTLDISPNPVDAVAQVSFTMTEPGRDAELVVLNSAGQLIYRAPVGYQPKVTLSLPAADWPTGTYTVLVKTRHTVRSGKLVKQ